MAFGKQPVDPDLPLHSKHRRHLLYILQIEIVLHKSRISNSFIRNITSKITGNMKYSEDIVHIISFMWR